MKTDTFWFYYCLIVYKKQNQNKIKNYNKSKSIDLIYLKISKIVNLKHNHFIK